ncbi:hypothetical protein [Streptomyces scabiei]|uniref:hypothetical protein n=1 Tax=Streptomyces scabiei TaxID=1930 RepID=UPI001B343BBC|nr:MULTISPECIES: hypothetical protein [Streptomyces]MBP5895225.1 hypothetical protein [Streptomyces sp. LBUM 1481]MBP5925503.1 hypothetical protein [Streptomyces sp. LBUM 1483]MDX2684087.1 hypothetical protein [Streptomyces scabiei]MDX2748886.1 hypothetical protein [Streptomyces scabiei]MDX2803075.1 hypothetical protein [Streptomyces scabiei]
MSHDQQFLVGSLLVLALLAVVVGVPLYVIAKVMPRIHRARRRREIETAMRLGVADRELMDEVAGELYYEREGRR